MKEKLQSFYDEHGYNVKVLEEVKFNSISVLKCEEYSLTVCEKTEFDIIAKDGKFYNYDFKDIIDVYEDSIKILENITLEDAKLVKGVVVETTKRRDGDSYSVVEIDGKRYRTNDYFIYTRPTLYDEIRGIIKDNVFITYGVEDHEWEHGFGSSLPWSMYMGEMVNYLNAHGHDVSSKQKVIELAKTVFKSPFEYDEEEAEFVRDEI